MLTMANIVAITITYHPDLTTFGPLLERLLAQASLVVVVDNTPGEANHPLENLISNMGASKRSQLIRLKENAGIARAINVGLDIALANETDFVLLSDQDSLPADDMAVNLFRTYVELSSQGLKVGAVGPTFTDLHTGLTYPFQVQLPGCFFYGHKAPTVSEPHVEALTLITSGVLIPAEAIRDVGPMREDFFIDQVDIEWCHRARWKGYRLFGSGWATMYQRMGEARLRVWCLRWRFESAYSPLRIYYRIRNFVALWKLDFVGFRWKVRSTWYWLGIIYAHTFFSYHNKLKSFLYAIKGFWHGLTNRMGPYT